MAETQQENKSELESLLSSEKLKAVDLKAQQTIHYISTNFAEIHALKNSSSMLIRSISAEKVIDDVNKQINRNYTRDTLLVDKIKEDLFLGRALYLEKVLNGLINLREKYSPESWESRYQNGDRNDFLKDILDKQIEKVKSYLMMTDNL